MSDNDSAVGTPPEKKAKEESKGKAKRAKSPTDEEQGPDGGSEGLTPKKKRGGNGAKKTTPTKSSKNGGAGTSSSGKGWTVEQKKELFKTVVGRPKQADFAEVADQIGKTPVQCHDQWRQVMYPAMLKRFDE